jgi:hypothetical protein
MQQAHLSWRLDEVSMVSWRRCEIPWSLVVVDEGRMRVV